MSATGSRPDKNSNRESEKPSLLCAICDRRYQPLLTPGMHTIYSICPDCRLDVATPARNEASSGPLEGLVAHLRGKK